MAVIIETGSGDNPQANSYVTEAELEAYAAARGKTLTQPADVLLTQAMDYAESLSYQGRQTQQNQPLEWPRTGVTIDMYDEPDSTIPRQLKTAQMVTALAINDGRNPLAVQDQRVKRTKVDVLEKEYFDSGSSQPIDIAVNRAFAKLLSSYGYGANQMRVIKS